MFTYEYTSPLASEVYQLNINEFLLSANKKEYEVKIGESKLIYTDVRAKIPKGYRFRIEALDSTLIPKEQIINHDETHPDKFIEFIFQCNNINQLDSMKFEGEGREEICKVYVERTAEQINEENITSEEVKQKMKEYEAKIQEWNDEYMNNISDDSPDTLENYLAKKKRKFFGEDDNNGNKKPKSNTNTDIIFNEEQIYKDIVRLSTLHSWYKHLSDAGNSKIINEFYFIPLKGEQIRYDFDPRVNDSHGIHWHLIDKLPNTDLSKYPENVQKVMIKYPVILNRYFYPGNDSIEYNRLCNLLLQTAKLIVHELNV